MIESSLKHDCLAYSSRSYEVTQAYDKQILLDGTERWKDKIVKKELSSSSVFGTVNVDVDVHGKTVSINLEESFQLQLLSSNKLREQKRFVQRDNGSTVARSSINFFSMISGVTPSPENLGFETVEKIIPVNKNIFCQGLVKEMLTQNNRNKEYVLIDPKDGSAAFCEFGSSKEGIVSDIKSHMIRNDIIGDIFIGIGSIALIYSAFLPINTKITASTVSQ